MARDPNPRPAEQGATAVEFALILSVLILLVVGIIQFSRLFNAQISLNHSTREGVRVLALTGDANAAADAARAAVTTLDPLDLSITTTACNSGDLTELSATYPFELRIPFFPDTDLTLESTGVMRCGG